MSHSSGVTKVLGDIWDLCELQWQLMSVDSQVARGQLIRAAICVVIAVTLGGSALTVTLIGLGVLLSELTTLSVASSLLAVTAAVFGISVVLGGIAIYSLKRSVHAMQRTKTEFSENIRWLKATLVSPGASPRNQLRRETFHTPSYDDHDDLVDRRRSRHPSASPLQTR